MLLSPRVPTVDVRDVADRQDRDPDSLVLLDVRSPEERAFTHIDGLHIPMNELPDRLDEVRAVADRQVVVYCRTGHRSASAVAWLRSRGLENVVNLEGGIHAWHREIDPEVKLY